MSRSVTVASIQMCAARLWRAALLIASRAPDQARTLVWTVIAIELVRGIGVDIYKIARGYKKRVPVTWMVVHSVIIATGLMSLGKP